jgi:hypothetical protein
MIRKRTRYDAMSPIPQTTWLIVTNQYNETLYLTELPPGTDPRTVMIEAMSRSIRKGFEVEELPGVIPIYYARKGEERRCISIVRERPDVKSRGL